MALPLKPIKAERKPDRPDELVVTFKDPGGVAREVVFTAADQQQLLQLILARPAASEVNGRLLIQPPTITPTAIRLLELAPDRGVLELQLDPLFAVPVAIDSACLRQLQAQLLPASQSLGGNPPAEPAPPGPQRH